MKYSVIVPVYNRPQEIRELLDSLSQQADPPQFEVIVIEDGSTIRCEDVVSQFSGLNIRYLYKENSGPGDSRNVGMRMALGEYFLIFDSDCILPPNYLKTVEDELTHSPVDFFGGPDGALDSFSDIQKAINFAMTSFLTTGGIRGGSEQLDRFQPRSFNMGISRKAFEASGGFGDIHPGEDPDLAIRLWKLGFKSRLLPGALVYHKRRIDWKKFALQVRKFGKARPILDAWHPQFRKWSYLFPSVFIMGIPIAVLLAVSGIYVFVAGYILYFSLVFLLASMRTKSIGIGALSVLAVWNQFYGYGVGYLESFVKIGLQKREPRKVFPELFFKKSQK